MSITPPPSPSSSSSSRTLGSDDTWSTASEPDTEDEAFIDDDGDFDSGSETEVD